MNKVDDILYHANDVSQPDSYVAELAYLYPGETRQIMAHFIPGVLSAGG